MWEVCIQHEGLRASRVLKGATQADAQWKATAQLLRWDQRWLVQQRALAARTRLDRRQLTLHGNSIAAALSAEAANHIAALKSLLATSLETGIFLHWDHLKDNSLFDEPPILPQPRRLPPPQLLKTFYAAELTALDALLPARRRRKEREAAERFRADLAAWQAACAATNRRAAMDDLRRREQREINRQRHHAAQVEQHAKVDQARAAFDSRDKDAVEYFFSELLSRSAYPAGLPEEATLHYIRSTKTLIVEYELPSFPAWPAFQQVRYVAARNALHELPLPETITKSSYENAIHQIALRVLSELFAHDPAHALERVALNGWVRSLDKSTGNMVHVRILSIVTGRDNFMAIKLAQVDPRACFRKLKGIVSSNPVDLLPVRSLMPVIHAAPHFSTSHLALDAFEESLEDGLMDLTSMRRSDFETLIREAFEREFRKNRNQVHLAQAGHDTPLDTLV